MYIKSVKLLGFGRLSGVMNFELGRCNIICQNNEFGKTTVMDAVLYALYNFPTTGFSRDTLKPKERYKPWAGEGRGDFVVELQLREIAGRNYCLRADFTRQQPFTLHDADTHQPIPLEGMTFGQRYLRMPLSSFTQCFFLRQDEKEGSGRNQLVSVIEEAASSNRREAPGNVSHALERLAGPRLNAPGIVDEPVLVKTLLKRLQEHRSALVASRDGLKRELDRFQAEVESAGEMDGRLAALDQQIARWEYDMLQVRRQEKQVLLNRFREGQNARAHRESMLAELEPYAGIDVERRSDIVSLLGDWKLSRERLEEARNTLAAEVEPEVQAAEADLADYPQTADTLTATDLETLRNGRLVLTDRQTQLARQREALASLETGLRAQGVPLDRLAEVQDKDSALSAADREILFEHGAAQNEAQAALVAIEQNALQAREQAGKAKTRRSWFANLGMGLTGLVVGFMVVGIVLLLTGNMFLGWVSLILAAVLGAGATLYVTAMRARISAQELEPAIQAEMALAAESRKIHEQLDTIESEYQSTLSRLQIAPENVQELLEIHRWRQAVAPWISTREAIERLEEETLETHTNMAPVMAALGRGTAGPDELNGEEAAAGIAGAIRSLEDYFELKQHLKGLREKLTRVTSERDRLESDFQAKEQALAALVESELTQDLPGLEEKAKAYLAGCEKALQLKTLRSEYGETKDMTEDEANALQADIDQLTEALAKAPGAGDESTGNDTLAGVRADELERRAAQARQERDDLKEQRSRGFREAEKAVNDWRTRGPELELELARVDEAVANASEFAQACEMAHGELSDIASHVYTQWATALNERVNHIMPLLNDRYSQVALSQDLELSVYSREAGRRLETRDVQHLSKGARDQLLLAVRIAIAQYLSAHVGNLPLALDEPFAHWDDARFVEGMRFLTNLSEQHQVILLSCHSWRYNQLKESAPDVYDKLVFNQLVAEEQLQG